MKAIIKPGNTSNWDHVRESIITEAAKIVETYSDTGGYYAPTVAVGTMYGIGDDRRVSGTDFVEVRFPSSVVRIVGRMIVVDGFRGSISDCVIPLLLAHGVQQWEIDSAEIVETTRPDATPWYVRAVRTVDHEIVTV